MEENITGLFVDAMTKRAQQNVYNPLDITALSCSNGSRQQRKGSRSSSILLNVKMIRGYYSGIGTNVLR